MSLPGLSNLREDLNRERKLTLGGKGRVASKAFANETGSEVLEAWTLVPR